MPFQFKKSDLKDVVIITPQLFLDERGYFLETYKKSEFEAFGICDVFIQENHSFSQKGILRGLHYQIPPHSQGKLVRCIEGEIFDVAVDIRKNSSTFGKWVGILLSEQNKKMCYIPQGFAHGFYTLSKTAHVLYKMTAEYSPQCERGIIWNDPTVGIQWPSDKAMLSEKDKNNPNIDNADLFE